MSLTVSIKAELIKTKRSAAFWLGILGAGLIPLVFFLMYVIKPSRSYDTTWELHMGRSWQSFTGFLLPMFVILICSLVVQIEYKNNAWKQVFASPQPISHVFFSKYLAIFGMIVLLFVMFNIFSILSAIVPNLFYSKLKFLNSSINWGLLFKTNIKTLISLLGIISIQYWLSLRFRNFIAPIGVGLALLIVALVLVTWEHIDKVPYAFPLLTFMHTSGEAKTVSKGILDSHEINSIIYFVVITAIALIDLSRRRERG